MGLTVNPPSEVPTGDALATQRVQSPAEEAVAMKTATLIITALAGMAVGLPASPRTLEYHYRGEVRTGLPSLRHQYSASAIEAKVLVTIKSPQEVDVQIKDAKVGSINDVVPGYKGHGQLPIPLEPFKLETEISKPFSVLVSGKQEKLMVPVHEKLWMSNIRKSIVSALRVPYVLSSPSRSITDLIENRIRSKSEVDKHFKKREDTIHGKCTAEYTLTESTPAFRLRLEQIPGDSRPKNTKAWRLVRVLDFDDCAEKVVMTQASHGNLTHAGAGQLRGVQSRSSLGEYLLTGTPSSRLSLTIEKAVIAGTVTLNPFGHDTTDKAITIANQTLSLVSKSGSAVPTPSNLKAEPWAFRVVSPFQKGTHSPSWVTFLNKEGKTHPIYYEQSLLGYSLGAEQRQAIKNKIKKTFKPLIDGIQESTKFFPIPYRGTTDGATVATLAQITTLLRPLLEQDIEELYTELVDNVQGALEKEIARKMFVDVIKSTGTGPSFKVIIKKITEKKIDHHEISKFFALMKSSVNDPTTIEDLINYVINSNVESKLVKTQVLINLSSFVRRFCIKPDKRHAYPRAVFGNNQCDLDIVENKFIPYLQDKLKTTSDTHLKAAYIQSLANVGDTSCVKTLINFSKNKAERKSLRGLAVNGLSKNNIKNTTFPIATAALLEIVEDLVEEPFIREAAIHSLFTMPQNASFWQHMSHHTWIDPSIRIRTLVHSLIHSVAHSRDGYFIHKISMAKHALATANPEASQANTDSENMYNLMSGWCTKHDFVSTLQGAFSAKSSLATPQYAMIKQLTALGGLKFPLFHASAIGNSWSDEQHREMHSEMEQLTEGMQSPKEADEELFIHLTALKHSEVLVPTDKSTPDIISEFVKTIWDKITPTRPHVIYHKLVDINEVIPTDIGLPLISQASQPSILYVEMEKKQSPQDVFAARLKTKLVVKLESSMQVLVPWNNQSLIANLDGETTVSVEPTVSVKLDAKSTSVKDMQIEISPKEVSSDEEVFFLNRMLPMTVRTNLLRSSPEYMDLNPVFKVDHRPIYNNPGRCVNYDGDVPKNPLSWETLVNCVNDISVCPWEKLSYTTAKQYQYSVCQSDTPFTLGLTMAKIPESSSAQSEEVLVQDLSTSDSLSARLHKVSQSPAGINHMMSASLSMKSSRNPSKYEIVVLSRPSKMVESHPTHMKEIKFQINLMKSSQNQSPSQMCLTSSWKWPAKGVQDKPLSFLLQHSSLPSSFINKLYTGEQCTPSSQNMMIKAMAHISHERRSKLSRELELGEDIMSSHGTGESKAAAVYDKFDMEIRKMKPVQPAIQNATMFAMDALHSVLFPLVEYNRIGVDGPSNLITINATRSMKTEQVTAWSHTPRSIASLKAYVCLHS